MITDPFLRLPNKSFFSLHIDLEHADAFFHSRLANFSNCLASYQTRHILRCHEFLLWLISRFRSQLRHGDERPIQRRELRRQHLPLRQPPQQALLLPPSRDPRRQVHKSKSCLQSILQRLLLRPLRIHATHQRHHRRPHNPPCALFKQQRGHISCV